MSSSNGANESKPSLDGLVFCANCGAEMVNTGLRYYCPNTTLESGRNCITKPMDAAGLTFLVVTKMVSRLLTAQTVEHIVEDIRDSTEANTATQLQRMELAEAAIAEANARRPAVLLSVEHGAKTYDDVADEIHELDQTTAGLAFESMVARNELDKIEFIRDEEGIQEAVRHPDTYLGGDSPDETQELVELIIQKVSMNSAGASIHYKVTMPSDEHPEGVQRDVVLFGLDTPS